MNRAFPSNKNSFVIQFPENSLPNQEHNTIRGFSQEPQQDQSYSMKHNSNFFEDKLINLHKQKRLRKQKAFHWTEQENYDYKIFCKRHIELLQNPDKNQRKQKKVFKEMAKEIKTRTDRQCRSHHQKAFPLLCSYLEQNHEGDQGDLDIESDTLESSSQIEQDSQNMSKQQSLQEISYQINNLMPQYFHFGHPQLEKLVQPQEFIQILQKLIQDIQLKPSIIERHMQMLYAYQEQLSQKTKCQSEFDIDEDIETPKTQIIRHINSHNGHNEQNRNPEVFSDILHNQDRFCYSSTTSLSIQNENEENQVELIGDGDESNQKEKASPKHTSIKKGIRKSKSASTKRH